MELLGNGRGQGSGMDGCMHDIAWISRRDGVQVIAKPKPMPEPIVLVLMLVLVITIMMMDDER